MDGDEYGIIPLEELPEFASFEPMLPGLYPPAERVTLNRPSTREDIADFFVDYIRSDASEQITTAKAHTHRCVLDPWSYRDHLAKNRRHGRYPLQSLPEACKTAQ